MEPVVGLDLDQAVACSHIVDLPAGTPPFGRGDGASLAFRHDGPIVLFNPPLGRVDEMELMPRRFSTAAPVFLLLALGLVMIPASGVVAQEASGEGTVAAAPSESQPAGGEASSLAATDASPTDEPPEPETWMTRFDHFFGDWLVTPLNKVLFFDFWTEQLAGHECPAGRALAVRRGRVLHGADGVHQRPRVSGTPSA